MLVREQHGALPVSDDDANLRLAQDKLWRQVGIGDAVVPARHCHAPVTLILWLLPGHEYMGSDLGREIGRRHRAPAVLAAHPDTTFDRPEQHLASGLYPGALQFKHQNKITLNLLGNPRNSSPCSPSSLADNIRHRLVGLRRTRNGDVLRDQFPEPGNEVAVRAAVGIAEQFEQASLDALGDDVLPPA